MNIFLRTAAALFVIGFTTSIYAAPSQTTKRQADTAGGRVITTKDGTKLNVIQGKVTCRRSGGKCGFQLPANFVEKKIRILIEYDDGTFEQSTIDVPDRVKNSGTIVYVRDPESNQRQKPRKVKHIYTLGDDGIWRV